MGILLLILACLMVSCSSLSERQDFSIDYQYNDRPFDRIVAETKHPLSFNPLQPFKLDFGRLSSWHGVNLFGIDESGKVHLYRLHRIKRKDGIYQQWERADLHLSKSSLSTIAKAIDDYRLVYMDRAYHKYLHDGSRWTVWIRQGDGEKRIYFDNYFPSSIRNFIDFVNRQFEKNGLNKADWVPISDDYPIQYSKEVWVLDE